MLALMFLGLHVATAMFLDRACSAIADLLRRPALLTRLGDAALERDARTTSCCRSRSTSCSARSWCAAARPTRCTARSRDWLEPLPGGLLHTNIGASALFSAVSGSSVATAATISTVALPSFRRRKYDERLVLGSIAAGASLGNLIPPGIAFIVYGVDDQHLGRRSSTPPAIIPGIDHDAAVHADDRRHRAAAARPGAASSEPRAPLRERLGAPRRICCRPARSCSSIVMGSHLHRLGDGDRESPRSA